MTARVSIFCRYNGLNFGDDFLGMSLQWYLGVLDLKDTHVYDILLQRRKSYLDRNVNSEYRPTVPASAARGKIFFCGRVLITLFKLPRYISIVRRSDIIIVAGGQLMVESAGNTCIFAIDIISWLCRILGKRFIVNSVGLSVKGPFYSRVAKGIINRAHYFSVRDSLSHASASKLVSPTLVGLHDDLGLTASRVIAPNDSCPVAHFGVNLMDTYSRFNIGVSSLEITAENLSAIASETGLLPRFIVTSFGQDQGITIAVANILANRNIPCEIVYLRTLQDLRRAYSGLSFMLACRMHSALFAVSYGVPCLIYEWDSKIEGIRNDLCNRAECELLRPISANDFAGLSSMSLSQLSRCKNIASLVESDVMARLERQIKAYV